MSEGIASVPVELERNLPYEHPLYAPLRLCGSHEVLDAMAGLPGAFEDADWFRLLGDEWSRIDWHWHMAGRLRQGLQVHGPLLMTPSERAEHSALPERVTVYRGCYADNADGLSWSLSRDVAVRFPTLTRHRRPGVPGYLVLTATVSREKCALKSDRNEFEVVAWAPALTDVVRIDYADDREVKRGASRLCNPKLVRRDWPHWRRA